MNIERAIKDVIETKLQEGVIERLVAENLEKGINKSLESLLGSYGDVTKVIESKIKDVMVKQLSGYDYSKYIVKLDYILTEILKNTALDNKKILENFKQFMTDEKIPNDIKLSDIFEKYCDYVAKDIDTSELEVNTDDTPTYEYVTVSFEVQEEEKKSWSLYSHATVFFECEKDEGVNFELRLSRWNEDKHWRLDFVGTTDLTSLRHLNEFQIYLIKLAQNCTKVIIDKYCDETEIQPEAEPEVYFS